MLEEPGPMLDAACSRAQKRRRLHKRRSAGTGFGSIRHSGRCCAMNARENLAVSRIAGPLQPRNLHRYSSL